MRRAIGAEGLVYAQFEQIGSVVRGSWNNSSDSRYTRCIRRSRNRHLSPQRRSWTHLLTVFELRPNSGRHRVVTLPVEIMWSAVSHPNSLACLADGFGMTPSLRSSSACMLEHRSLWRARPKRRYRSPHGLLTLPATRCAPTGSESCRGRMREMRLRHRPMQLLGTIPAHCVSAAQQRIYEDIVDMRLIMGR